LKEQLKVFEPELNQIHNEKIKEFTIRALEKLPEYFWKIPASSTGKYHPSYSLGDGGLARHTKAAVRIAIELFNLDMWKFDEVQKDIILSALFLHDGNKSGKEYSKYTVHDHPLLVAEFIKTDEELNQILQRDIIERIANGIESHMGQWNTTKYSEVVLPKPENGIQKFIHMCDYLASRKCIEINFNV
jgi:23S rRNA maturation-related 3'-5' exoribonuclease YhaM